MKMQLIIENDYGIFESEVVEVSEQHYEGMLEISKNFHLSQECFNMKLNNNSGTIFIPPDLIKKSMLIVRTI